VSQRKGLFEQATGGTLFIDEIGDLAPSLQPKLLRAVERGEVRRVGGDRWISVDARIIAATRRDLDKEVQDGRFRDDLWHRLAVARIELPPLRDRRGDVSVLAAHFWKQLGGGGGADPALLSNWEKLPWPGNIRELRNAVARRLALGDLDGQTDDTLGKDAGGGDFIDTVVGSGVPLVRGRAVVASEYERRYIERILAEHGGNVVHAARASGIARRHFQRLRARTKKT
jgi:transcriptional regulator with GAF, ATPase, and Fis domain